ncbi:response regulator [Paenibacillus humicola]|uniref:response regulator n=1 Tax=Paenibacillus humicola TaxID=3110540 RepID=UPI00237C2757|nr:response regulator [Paenibacillus humicola]
MPLKVLIVDDEPSNLAGLVRNIDWNKLGFDVPAACESGEEALVLLRQTAFDVLISDVAMPGMNGIELVAEAKKLHPHLQVLMISGYNEFEFVQDAIHVGAQAYVLKPLKPEEVTSRLTAFRDALERMRSVVEQTRELEEKVSGSLKLIKERFVLDLIAEEAQSEETLASWNRLMEVPRIGQGFHLLVIGLDRYQTSGREAQARMRLGSGFKKTVEIGFSDVESVFLAQSAPDEFIAMLANPTPEERVLAEKRMQFVQEMMQEQHGATVTIGCSRTGSRWDEAPLLYRETKFMMAKARLVAEGQIVRYDGHISGEFNDYRLREEWMPKLVQLMEAGDAEKAGGYLNRMLDVLLTRETVSFSYAQAFGMNFLSELFRHMKPGEEPGGETSILMWRRMLDCGSAGQIAGLLTEYVERCMQNAGKERAGQQHHLIRNVSAFIAERLKENWTVKQLAEQFNLNASYLSVLFKRETGKTISEFVQATRIERAKALLQDPGIKVYEVADEVGIQTSAYFTYLFKKLVGCTPQEYRDYHYSAEGE